MMPQINDYIYKEGKPWKVKEIRHFNFTGINYIIFVCENGKETRSFEKNGIRWESIPEEIKAELV